MKRYEKQIQLIDHVTYFRIFLLDEVYHFSVKILFFTIRVLKISSLQIFILLFI